MARGNGTVDEVAEPIVTDEVDTPSVDNDVEDVSGAAEAPKAEVVNLDAFWAAVDATDGSDYSIVEAEYGKLSRGGKLQAKNGIKTRVMAAVEVDDFAKAKVLGAAGKALGEVTSSTAGATVDPSEELSNRIAALNLAHTHLTNENPSLAERVAALIESPNEAVQALKTRLIETKMGRKPRENSGTRHNVGKHIAQIFEGKDSGTFLNVKEITEAKSEEYGTDSASVASVSAHLKSGKFDQAGLEVIEQDKKLGVRKS